MFVKKNTVALKISHQALQTPFHPKVVSGKVIRDIFVVDINDDRILDRLFEEDKMLVK